MWSKLLELCYIISGDVFREIKRPKPPTRLIYTYLLPPVSFAHSNNFDSLIKYCIVFR